LKIFWHYLGQKNARHYYISKDRVAAFTTPAPIEDAWDWGDAEEGRQLYMRIADEVCELARAQPSAYVWLLRAAPPLLHVHTNGELWLALDDWPRPQDVLRVGRLPYAGPEVTCDIYYVLDVARRERTRNAYVRVVRKHATVFHFQVRSSTVIVAQRA
jgi:hypothetical protein